ncbi:MAG: hypothetical protein HKN82_07125 [Akkermansiaceae bacterium]|nr:hypothetical protein [Akkermansiaceae bacterium]
MALAAAPLPAATEKYRLIWRDDPSTTMTVGWNQVGGSNPTVHYDTVDHGTDPGSYASSRSPDRSVSYRGMSNQFARLAGLQADTVYYFVIADSNSTSQRFSFRTAPDTPQPFTFIAGGDSRNNRGPRQNANLMVSKLRPLFVAFGGDFIDTDTSSQWQEWFNDWQLSISPDGRMTPVVAARGNHEFSNSSIVNLFDVPQSSVYYALTFGGNLLRSYTLNSEIVEGGSQASWLDGDLAANSGVTWKMAQYHKPMRPHTSGKSEGTGEYGAWASIFFNRGMDLVVECDSHLVKRTYPVQPDTGGGSDEGFIRNDAAGTLYIGEGGWGAPLRSANDNKNWTMASGSMNQVQWVEVSPAAMQVRTIRTGNAALVGEATDSDPFTPPANLDLWRPATGDTITLPYTAPASSSPTCSAGPDRTVLPAELASLDGTVSDDGPLANVSASWSLISGPGEVYFYTPDAVDTTADFGALGEYVLRLTVDDGDHTAFDDVCVTVTEGSAEEVRIASGNDDGEEDNANGAMSLTSTDLELVHDTAGAGKVQTVGMRFLPGVPQGAAITNAWIQFTTDETSTGAANLTFRGQAADDAPAFTTGDFNISSRPVTTASVAWNPPEWLVVPETGPAQRTPDLSPIVEEIISRPGWSAGNGMVIIATGSGQRVAESYNGSSSTAALLHVEYAVTVPPLTLWNFTNFTPAERADPSISGPSANPDLDPFVNIFEFGFNLDPRVGNPNVMDVRLVNDGGTDYPALAYPRRKNGTGTPGVDYSADGITYRVLTSEDLLTWSGGVSRVEFFSVTDDGNGVTETVEIRSENPAGSLDREFLRLEINSP